MDPSPPEPPPTHKRITTMSDRNPIWLALRATDDAFVKPIKEGPLGKAGLSNINPTYVREQLAQTFGDQGTGYRVRTVSHEYVTDPINDEVTYHVLVELQYRLHIAKDKESGAIVDLGEWSEPVQGWGQCKAAYNTQSRRRFTDPFHRQKAHTNGLKSCAAELGSGADIRLGEDYSWEDEDSTDGVDRGRRSHEGDEPRPEPEQEDRTPREIFWDVWKVKAKEVGIDARSSIHLMSRIFQDAGITSPAKDIDAAVAALKAWEPEQRFDSDDPAPPLPDEEEDPKGMERSSPIDLAVQLLQAAVPDCDDPEAILKAALPADYNNDLGEIETEQEAAALAKIAINLIEKGSRD